MMSDDPSTTDLQHFFEVLEVPPDASFADVAMAYNHLKSVFTGGSIAIDAIPEEFATEKVDQVLDEIEEAYIRLSDYFSRKRRAETLQSRSCRIGYTPLPKVGVYSGPNLKKIRTILDISLDEIARETKIPIKHLQNMEEENMNLLPAPVYLRGYIAGYASCLAIDPEKAVSDYMSRYKDSIS